MAAKGIETPQIDTRPWMRYRANQAFQALQLQFVKVSSRFLYQHLQKLNRSKVLIDLHESQRIRRSVGLLQSDAAHSVGDGGDVGGGIVNFFA